MFTFTVSLSSDDSTGYLNTPSYHVYAIDTDGTAQKPTRPATARDDRNSEGLPLRSALLPRASRHIPSKHNIIATIGTHGQASRARLTDSGRRAAVPRVDGDLRPAPDVALGDADADGVGGGQLRLRQLEVDDVVVVDVLEDVAREAGRRRRPHDVVRRVPVRQPAVRRVHVRRLHGRVPEVQEPPRRPVPLADAPDRRRVRGVGYRDRVHGRPGTRAHRHAAGVHFEFLSMLLGKKPLQTLQARLNAVIRISFIG